MKTISFIEYYISDVLYILLDEGKMQKQCKDDNLSGSNIRIHLNKTEAVVTFRHLT